jgi:hypothetical protein
MTNPIPIEVRRRYKSARNCYLPEGIIRELCDALRDAWAVALATAHDLEETQDSETDWHDRKKCGKCAEFNFDWQAEAHRLLMEAEDDPQA